jgi:hypothetical protein
MNTAERDRLAKELDDLRSRFERLECFLFSDRFYSLSARHQTLLLAQRFFMDAYAKILRERLECVQ